MKHLFPLVLLLATFASAPLRADPLEEQLVAQLTAQGYGRVEVGHTLLGRLRITAVLGEFQREIVVNPRTGEILRDYQSLIPRYADRSSGHGMGAGSTAATATAADTGDAPELLDRSSEVGKGDPVGGAP
ncbi:hypothetical protein SAMN04488103_103195 [Gemmobacter aquatilis]|uniref:Peptidase propeptide and YPEB domain-containing protein n=1 Tax=Gemmobacter aquatilis TaxID=933059 RepID=A0A1H8E412_9RHOB|nr:hypothetical protein [Gemmobacter aquatilis]SEN13528.1 hypothetical protein SAMN04488103_103195 [Gemmobacter aquatilis]